MKPAYELGWQHSGKECILEDSFDHYQVYFAIRSSRLSKKDMIQKIRESIAEERSIRRFPKELNKEFLFSWTDGSSQSDIYISETDKIRIKGLLNEDVDMNWIENAKIRGYKKSITFTDRNDKKVLSFAYEKGSRVFLKIKNKGDKNYKKVLKLAMEMENDRRRIYKLPSIDLALHIEVDYSKLNYQDIDNVQKTVLDALKRDKNDSSWKYLYEDDAQIVRVLCWKTKKEEDEKWNMEALTISYRVYNPKKQMCMVMLYKSFGARGLSRCKDDF